MIYNKIQFMYGSPVEFGYLIVSDQGIEDRLTDLSGNTLSLGGCGYVCIEPNPLPDWAE